MVNCQMAHENGSNRIKASKAASGSDKVVRSEEYTRRGPTTYGKQKGQKVDINELYCCRASLL